jgi:peptide-methionine (S)-S-oxide reductase
MTVAPSHETSLRVPLDQFPDPEVDVLAPRGGDVETAVLAGGCFWCVEAVYQQLDGVLNVTSGYVGGSEATADYQTVCSGTTNHAEAVQVRFNPNRISFGQLLKVFFSVTHDPTQKNQQGPDVGRQYRSAVFCLDREQQEVAEKYIAQLDSAGVFAAPIVTEVAMLDAFYPAEAYHQNYASQNPGQPYIVYHALPKVKTLTQHFGGMLRPEP